MKFRWQQIGIGLIAISTSFLSVSCSEGKVSQCAKVIEVINQTVTETKTITADGTKGDVSTIEKSVGIFEKAAKNMESISVKDQKLKTYQGQFVTMYQSATAINKELVASIKEKKLTRVMEGLKKSSDILSPEKDLATGLTQYCKEPEK